MRLGHGIAALLAGDFRWAGTLLDTVRDDRSADSTHRLLAQLASTVIELVTVGCDDPSARLGQIALDAELAGLPWVARLARGLGEAVLVALGSPAWRVTACIDLLGECERTGDDWGAALLRLAVAIAGQIADPTSDPDEFADAARRFRRLDAPVLALWAESLQACVLAREGAAGAGEFARRVAAQARAAPLGGAQVLALAALAVAPAAPIRPGPVDASASGRPCAARWSCSPARHRREPLRSRRFRSSAGPAAPATPDRDAPAEPLRAAGTAARTGGSAARRGGAVLRRVRSGGRRDPGRPVARCGHGPGRCCDCWR